MRVALVDDNEWKRDEMNARLALSFALFCACSSSFIVLALGTLGVLYISLCVVFLFLISDGHSLLNSALNVP